MARPIEATPILYGKDAKRFLKDFYKMKLTKETLAELERCERLYKDFIARMM